MKDAVMIGLFWPRRSSGKLVDLFGSKDDLGGLTGSRSTKFAKNWLRNMKFRHLNIPFRMKILLAFSLMEVLLYREIYSGDGSRQRRKRIVFAISYLLIIGYLPSLQRCFFIRSSSWSRSSDNGCQRRRHASRYRATLESMSNRMPDSSPVKDFHLLSHYRKHPDSTIETRDLVALKEREKPRIITRVAPMLGLVGTMIPMGSALKSLADGNVQGISENLIVAFPAGIFGLVTASMTFCLVAIQKRWLEAELTDIQGILRKQRVNHEAS